MPTDAGRWKNIPCKTTGNILGLDFLDLDYLS